MRNKKWIAVLCTSVLTCSMTVNAAPFDAAYYAMQNPDVVAVIGNDPTALYMHFITIGVNEGRFGNATFNAAEYKEANPDLAAVLGTDLMAYANHYMTAGQAEGRKTGISSGSKGSGSSSAESNPYARFQTSGSSSSKHSKGGSSDEKEESNSSESSVEAFTGYNVNGITGPSELHVGDEQKYVFSVDVTESIPSGFEIYRAIDDLDMDEDAVTIVDWHDDGGVTLRVDSYTDQPIILTGIFNVRNEGSTGRDDPNNIVLAHEERTKTVTIVCNPHNWNSSTGKCDTCGEECEHDTEDGTCGICGATVP